jgi:hypothetical protein
MLHVTNTNSSSMDLGNDSIISIFPAADVDRISARIRSSRSSSRTTGSGRKIVTDCGENGRFVFWMWRVHAHSTQRPGWSEAVQCRCGGGVCWAHMQIDDSRLHRELQLPIPCKMEQRARTIRHCVFLRINIA